MSHSDKNAHAALAECDHAPAQHTGWSRGLVAILAVAGLLLGVGMTIACKTMIEDDAVAFARDCAARGGRVRLEPNLRQCVTPRQENTQNDY